MPYNKTLYDALVKQYGAKKAAKVYFGMKNEKSKSYQKGLKTAKKQGHIIYKIKDGKK